MTPTPDPGAVYLDTQARIPAALAEVHGENKVRRTMEILTPQGNGARMEVASCWWHWDDRSGDWNLLSRRIIRLKASTLKLRKYQRLG